MKISITLQNTWSNASDIKKFHLYFKENYTQVIDSGETVDYPLHKLFKAYMAAQDATFVKYMGGRKEEYYEKREHVKYLNHYKLMTLAINNCLWGASTQSNSKWLPFMPKTLINGKYSHQIPHHPLTNTPTFRSSPGSDNYQAFCSIVEALHASQAPREHVLALPDTPWCHHQKESEEEIVVEKNLLVDEHEMWSVNNDHNINYKRHQPTLSAPLLEAIHHLC